MNVTLNQLTHAEKDGKTLEKSTNKDTKAYQIHLTFLLDK